MNAQTRNKQGRPAVPAVLILSAALFVLAACGGGEQAAPTPPPPATVPAVTAETGGMSLSGASGHRDAIVDLISDPTATAATAATAEAATVPPLALGATISAVGPLAVYADADPAATRFAVYTEGAVFTVLEPGGDYLAYPLEVDGRRWYRVRAPDGLVGWVVEP